MKKNLLLLLLLCAMGTATAQTDSTDAGSGDVRRNFVKMNLSSLVLKTFSFQYERVLSKRWSVAIGFSTMPSSDVPFKSSVLDAVGDDEAAKFIIDNSKFEGTTFTPEIRFYLSKKGYGRGFYLAPYYRYSKFKTDNVLIQYQDDTNTDQVFKMAGDVSGNSGGLMFGAQWVIGKHFTIDWWIVGAHIGSASGQLAGNTTQILSPTEQASIKEILDDFEIPFIDSQNEVTATSAKVIFDGSWGGVRAFGLNVGYRF